jgi:crotonobetainyl-CoA:carnitine CoA-transferase CaiB-like acyl-CoA transferase
MSEATGLPLSGLRVLDLGHTVMGPSCGMILADLGADVLKVEPAPAGDPTRRLKGFGAGYFGYFSRNKRSMAVDLKTEAGKEIAHRLVARCDVLIENFAPRTMERLGLGYETLRPVNPRLIYASLKGFLKGPYEERPALDEVVQMMSGLAYMTGPSGRPLRAGTSIVDIGGGMFAVIAILIALRERDRTGVGQLVESGLFETAVFFMGQHLCYAAQSNAPVPPMPERVSAWAVYEPFAVSGGRQIFVGITSDNHWQRFCAELGRDDLARDPAYATNNDRIAARPQLIPALRQVFRRHDDGTSHRGVREVAHSVRHDRAARGSVPGSAPDGIRRPDAVHAAQRCARPAAEAAGHVAGCALRHPPRSAGDRAGHAGGPGRTRLRRGGHPGFHPPGNRRRERG